MTPNLALIEGLHGVAWDAEAAEQRVERLMAGLHKLPPEMAIGLSVLIAQADAVLQQALELLAQAIEGLDAGGVPVPGPLSSVPCAVDRATVGTAGGPTGRIGKVPPRGPLASTGA